MNSKSEGLQYGYGVFETILVKNNSFQFLQDHIDRLQSSLKALHMPLVSKESIELELYEETQNITEPCFVVKLICYLDESVTRTLVVTRPYVYTSRHFKEGFKTKLSHITRHSSNPILKHKTTNYLCNILEHNQIKSEGWDEAIHLNEAGQLTEGIFSNMFWIKDQVLYTPDVSSGLLPGTQRKRIIERAKTLGITLKIGYYGLEALESADEVFLTNAVMGIMPIASFGDITYDIKNNDYTKRLMKEMLL